MTAHRIAELAVGIALAVLAAWILRRRAKSHTRTRTTAAEQRPAERYVSTHCTCPERPCPQSCGDGRGWGAGL